MPVASVILECFTDYVGIQSCEATEENAPGSGLFISDLPGISNALIQAITDPNAGDETFLDTWNKIQNRAILTFRTRLLAEINECYKINKLDTIECLACENLEVFAVALQYLLGNFTMIQALFNWTLSRFSTTDRKTVELIRDYYFEQFGKELKAAVKGIDVLDSDCIVLDKQCKISQNGRISIQQSRM